MPIDVPTLYCLTVGTLCVAGAMTLWERRTAVHRARELGIWAGAYAVLAVGCLLMMERRSFPGATGSALSNVVFVVGYLGLLWGACSLTGRRLPAWPFVLVAATALGWAVFGAKHEALLWNHASALPIAAACCATAWTLRTSGLIRALRSRPLAAAILGGHGLFYLARAAIFPFLVAAFGEEWIAISATATMFEGVLFSVAMPMAFLALVREETERRLTAASETDFLTGVDNRRAFMTKATRLLDGREQPVSLVVFDLDHFKAVNDRHGHATGDEVLRAFCRVARGEMSSGDVFGRLGGEEFAIALRGCGAEEARRLAVAISKRYTAEAGRGFALSLRATVSAGVAEGRRGAAELGELLGLADGALYRAKKAGRDQAVVADRPVSPSAVPETRAA